MPKLVKGVWVLDDLASPPGEDQEILGKITADGSTGFPAEADRYHLYFSYACPFAAIVLAAWKLKGLEKVVTASPVDCGKGDDGWTFGKQDQALFDSRDPLFGFGFLREVYQKARPDFTGRVVVPVLFDKIQGKIVSNNSGDIMRMFDTEFGPFAAPNAPKLYPEDLCAEINDLNKQIYTRLNTAVYSVGLSRTQEEYNTSVVKLFTFLDECDARLEKTRYLMDENRLTECDCRLWASLVRFDAVYYMLFRCNLRRVADYKNLTRFLRDLYHKKNLKSLVNIGVIKHDYFCGFNEVNLLNPMRIVPMGPNLEYFTDM